MSAYFNICNECTEVWQRGNACPCCGSKDYDMEDDTARWDGGLDYDA